MKLKNKKVFITGGGVRIGAAIARAFAARGAKLLLHCSRSIEDAEQLIAEFGGREAGHSVTVCDLTEPSAPEQLEEVLKEANILINNASTYLRRKLTEETAPEAERQFRINYTVPVELMRRFAVSAKSPELVINLLDQGICRPAADSFSYAISKKALAEATRGAALQLAPRIRVNGIAPGPVLPPVELPFSTMEKTLKKVPMGKPVALQDLISGALFLAENDSVTGEILVIDGGQSLT